MKRFFTESVLLKRPFKQTGQTSTSNQPGDNIMAKTPRIISFYTNLLGIDEGDHTWWVNIPEVISYLEEILERKGLFQQSAQKELSSKLSKVIRGHSEV